MTLKHYRAELRLTCKTPQLTDNSRNLTSLKYDRLTEGVILRIGSGAARTSDRSEGDHSQGKRILSMKSSLDLRLSNLIPLMSLCRE